jgi:hypothetical protein
MTPSIWQLLIVILFLGLPFILGLIFIRKKEYSALSENQKYAGFWYRFLAGIIDSIILIFLTVVIGLIILMIIGTHQIELILIADAVSPLIAFFYFVLFQTSSKQSTPGMMALNIKIYNFLLQCIFNVRFLYDRLDKKKTRFSRYSCKNYSFKRRVK